MTTTLTLVNFKKETIDDNVFNVPKMLYDEELNLISFPGKKSMKIIK